MTLLQNLNWFWNKFQFFNNYIDIALDKVTTKNKLGVDILILADLLFYWIFRSLIKMEL